MTAYFKPPDLDPNGDCENRRDHLEKRNILPNQQVQSSLICSIFVLDEEVAMIDRFLGKEIAALFQD